MPPKRILVIIAALIVLLAGYNLIFKWPAKKITAAKQEQFLEAIEKRKWGRISRLTSDGYADSFDLDRDELLLALKDLRTPVALTELDLEWQTTDIQRDDDGAVIITGTLEFSGKGGPAAAAAIAYAKQFSDSAFSFHWRKTGTLPWKWQLEEIDHPDASLPPGYTPGQIVRMMQGGEL